MGLFSKYKPVAQFQAADKPAKVASKLHLFIQKLYAVTEPTLLRKADKTLNVVETETNPTKRQIVINKYVRGLNSGLAQKLPSGIVFTTKAAETILELAATIEGPKGARIAVGRCPCQEATNKWRDPVVKDIVLFFGAEAYVDQEVRISRNNAGTRPRNIA